MKQRDVPERFTVKAFVCEAQSRMRLSGDELDRALAGDEEVVEHAGGGNHGKAAVLELHELAARKGLPYTPAGQTCSVRGA
eukprot:822566-Rhodomonas_salina.1